MGKLAEFRIDEEVDQYRVFLDRIDLCLTSIEVGLKEIDDNFNRRKLYEVNSRRLVLEKQIDFLVRRLTSEAVYRYNRRKARNEKDNFNDSNNSTDLCFFNNS